MPRQRYQTGKLFKKGKRCKQWYGRYYVYVTGDDGKERRKFKLVVLGAVAKMTKTDAQRKLQGIIDRETSQPGARPDPETLWQDFIRDRFLPTREDSWKPSTKKSTLSFYETVVIPAFAARSLDSINEFDCQKWLNRQKGKPKSHVLHANTHLKAVFRAAVRQKFLDQNPAEELIIPRYRQPAKRHLSVDEIRLMIAGLLELRDRLIFRLHILCDLRPGETFALRWDDWQGAALRIDENLEGSSTRVGDTPKTQASASMVALTDALQRDLEAWKLVCKPKSEREFIFGGERPRSYNSYLKDVLQPVATGLGIHGLTFQCLRRTASTLQSKHGTPKDVQTQMRHADVPTTFGIYVQEIPESVRAMIEAVEHEIRPQESKPN